MKNKHFLEGRGFKLEVAWSKKSDGPMNLIGKEFDGNPISYATGLFGFFSSHEAGDRERLANRAAFLKRALDVSPANTAVPKPLHGTDIRYVEYHNSVIEDLPCDGLITDMFGFALTMTFADCPTLVVMDGNVPFFAVAHCGWRGVAGGIVEKTVGKVNGFGSYSKESLQVLIAPGIRGCCFEVGPDVATQIEGKPHVGRVFLDLPTEIIARLISVGVPQGNIKFIDTCTKCGVDSKSGKPVYWSYRRDKKSDPLDANMLAAVLR